MEFYALLFNKKYFWLNEIFDITQHCWIIILIIDTIVELARCEFGGKLVIAN